MRLLSRFVVHESPGRLSDQELADILCPVTAEWVDEQNCPPNCILLNRYGAPVGRTQWVQSVGTRAGRLAERKLRGLALRHCGEGSTIRFVRDDASPEQRLLVGAAALEAIGLRRLQRHMLYTLPWRGNSNDTSDPIVQVVNRFNEEYAAIFEDGRWRVLVIAKRMTMNRGVFFGVHAPEKIPVKNVRGRVHMLPAAKIWWNSPLRREVAK